MNHILKAVLPSLAGEYLSGVDFNSIKTSYLTGEISIENVALNPSIFQKQGLPFLVNYSNIGKLEIKVPWLKAKSEPSVVKIRDMHILMTMAAPNKVEPLTQRIAFLDEITKQCYAKVKALDSKEGKEGAFAGLKVAIIDNLQVSIHNLHIRIEDPDKGNSLGFTLKEFSFYTTDDKWEKGFSDRTQEANKLKNLNKKAEIKDFGFYFRVNELEKHFISSEKFTDTYRQKFLGHYIDEIHNEVKDKEKVRIVESIFRISYEMKITLRSKYMPLDTEPKINVRVILRPHEAKLEHNQLEELLGFLERMAIIKEKTKFHPIAITDDVQRIRNEKDFKFLIRLLVQWKMGQEISWATELDPKNERDEHKRLKQLLPYISDEDVLQALHETIFNSEKNKIVEHLHATKNKNNDGLGKIGGALKSFFAAPKKEVVEVPEVNVKELQDFIFGMIKKSEDEFKRGSEGYLTRFEVLIEKSSVFLMNSKSNDTTNGIWASLQGFRIVYEQKNLQRKASTILTLSLYNSEILLKSKYPNQDLYKEFVIMRKVRSQNNSLNLIDFQLISESSDEKSYTSITANIGEAELHYLTAFIYNVIKFVQIEEDVDNLNTLAVETIEDLKASAQQNIQEYLDKKPEIAIKINFASSKILIPVNQNGDVNSDCWLINLGSCQISTSPSKKENPQYKIICIQLKDFYMLYFDSVKNYHTWIALPPPSRSKEECPKPRVLINDSSFSMEIMTLDPMLDDDDALETTKITCNFGEIIMASDIFLLEKLIMLPEYTDYTKESDFHELLEIDKRNIMRSKPNLFKVTLGKEMDDAYIALFYQNYLYLYKNPMDLAPARVIWIKNAAVRLDLKKNFYTIWLKEGNHSYYISLEDRKSFDIFIEILHKKTSKDPNYISPTKPKLAKKKSSSLDLDSTNVSKKPLSMIDTKALDKVLMNMNVQFQKIKYTLGASRSQFTFELSEFGFGMMSRAQRKEMSVTISDFHISARRGDVGEDLISSQLRQPMTSNSSSSSNSSRRESTFNDLVRIQYTEYEDKHPYYRAEHCKAELNVIFNTLHIFWKPLYMNELIFSLKLIANKTKQDEESKASTDMYSQKKKSTRDLEAFRKEIKHRRLHASFQERNLKLLKARIKIAELSCSLFIPQLDIEMTRISLVNLNVDYILQEETYRVDGSLKNLQIWDLTNYPFTIKKKEDRVAPVEIFGVDKNVESLLEFSMVSLSEGHPDVQENTYSFLRVKLNSVMLNFVMQPVMRMIDYLMNYILNIPLPAEVGQIGILKFEEALQTIQKPKFMAIKVEIAHPKICLRHLPKAPNYLVLDLGNIDIYNQIQIGKERLHSTTPSITKHYNEKFIINFKNINIYRVNAANEKTSLSEHFQLSIEFEQCKFVEETKLVLNYELKQSAEHMPLKDNRYVSIRISSLELKLSHEDYMELMDCVFHNIINDDEQDPTYIFNPQVLVEDSSLISLKPTEERAVPMAINIIIGEVTIILWDEIREMPLTKLEAVRMSINMDKKEDRKSNIIIDFEDISGYHYERIDATEITETPMLSVTQDIQRLTLKKRRSLVLHSKKYKYAEDDQRRESLAADSSPPRRVRNFRITVSTQSSGDKTIDIDIKDIKFILYADDLLRIAEFNSYMPEELYERSIHNDENQIVAHRAASSDIRILIETAFICMPSAGRHCPILKGNIMLNYTKFDLLNIVKETMLRKQFIDYSRIGVVLQNNELFVCDFEDFIVNKDVSEVKKRSIIHPFSLSFNMKESLCSAEEGAKIMTKGEKNVHIDKIIVRIASKDLILMLKCADLQQQKLGLYHQFTKFANREYKIKQIAERPQREGNLSLYDASFDTLQEELKFVHGGFQLRLINETKNYSVPLLDISLLGTDATHSLVMLRTGNSTQYSGDVIFSSYYYNSKASLWEPVLEKFTLHYKSEYSVQSDPQLTLNVSIKHSINLNITNEMIDNFLTTFFEWKGKYDRSNQKLERSLTFHDTPKKSIRSKVGHENVEYVSPYSVLNLSGYEMEVISSSESKYELRLREGGKSDILFETNMEDIFSNMESADLFAYHTLFIRLHHPQLGQLTSQSLAIGDIGTKLVQYEDSEALEGLPSNSRLICDISIEGKKKLITFGSSIQIKNHLSSTLIARVETDVEGQLERVIESEGFSSLPFDLKRGEISFVLRNESNQESPATTIKIQELLRYDKSEFSFGNCNGLIRIEKRVLFLIVHFEPFAIIRNCLPLPLEFELSNRRTAETRSETGKLQPQQDFQATSLFAKEALYLSVKLEGTESSSRVLLSPSSKELTEGIRINHTDGPLRLILHKGETDSYTQEFVIYSAICILNQTTLPIFMTYTENKYLPGHDANKSFNLLILDRECKLKVNQMVGDVHLSSDDLNTKVVGDFPVDLKCIGNERLNLGASITTQRCDSKFNLFTKMIVISPRYIILNESKETLIFSQAGLTDNLRIETNERNTLHFQGMAQDRLLKFTIAEKSDSNQWEWSGSIDCTASGEFFPVIQNKYNNTMVYYKAAVLNAGPIIYIELTEQEPDKAAYLIDNKLEDLDVVVYQEGYTDCKFSIGPQKRLPFCWKEPCKKQEIVIILSRGGQVVTMTKCRLDRIGETVSLVESNANNTQTKQLSVYCEVNLEGKSRVLRVFERKEENKIKSMSFHFYFKFAGIGVSLISNKRELIYLTFSPAFLAIKSDGYIMATQFRVKLIEIDNNSSRTSPFPVMMYPKHLTRLEDPHYYNLDIITRSRVKQSSSDITYFDRISVLLNETFLKVDGNLLDNILLWAKDIEDLAYKLSPQTANPIHHLFRSPKERENALASEGYFWQIHKPESVIAGYVFIRSLTLYPIFINLTYHYIHSSGGSHILLSYFKSLFGSTLANFDDAPLTLVGIKLDGVFDGWDGIIKKLANRYSSKVTEAVLGIALSSNIIGNPIKFFGGIANGVTDLFEKPLEGFREGPLEGGLGIIEGVGSLASKTVGGAFNSVHNITGSLANGISQLVADEAYNVKRQRENAKSNTNIFSGLYQGFKSFGAGTLEGITGVVKKPAESYAKQGMSGLMKGTLQGVTGLLVKPIAGSLDAVSKVTEGVSNTFDSKRHVSKTEKFRLPRVFYGKEGIIKHYLEYDALALDIISKYKREKYLDTELDWMEGFHLHYEYTVQTKNVSEQKHMHLYLVMTMNRLFLVNFITNSLQWKIKLNYIDRVMEGEKDIVLLLRKKPKMIKQKETILIIPQKEVRIKVLTKLKKLRELYFEISSRFDLTSIK